MLPPQREALERLQAGNFEAVLGDFVQGPNLVRPYLFWHSDGPFNYGHYKSTKVDRALDTIRHAVSDDDYRRGVVAFHRAILDDPPAIFLVWTDRARAVSSQFDVSAESSPDVWTTLWQWRPVTDARLARTH
jgi:ABC-type transport system substrate-binding protein